MSKVVKLEIELDQRYVLDNGVRNVLHSVSLSNQRGKNVVTHPSQDTVGTWSIVEKGE